MCIRARDSVFDWLTAIMAESFPSRILHKFLPGIVLEVIHQSYPWYISGNLYQNEKVDKIGG
jgi:hypothetical protein